MKSSKQSEGDYIKLNHAFAMAMFIGFISLAMGVTVGYLWTGDQLPPKPVCHNETVYSVVDDTSAGQWRTFDFYTGTAYPPLCKTPNSLNESQCIIIETKEVCE